MSNFFCNSGENVLFYYDMLMSNLYFILLAHWNNSSQTDMLLLMTNYPDSEPVGKEAANTNFINIGWVETIIFCIQGKRVNHFPTEVYFIVLLLGLWNSISTLKYILHWAEYVWTEILIWSATNLMYTILYLWWNLMYTILYLWWNI
jgi:hypothetical protein